jgi:hypothetical protein
MNKPTFVNQMARFRAHQVQRIKREAGMSRDRNSNSENSNRTADSVCSIRHNLGQAKVGNFDVAIVRQHEILGLQITIDAVSTKTVNHSMMKSV